MIGYNREETRGSSERGVTPELRVQMLGEFDVTYGGVRVSAVNTPRLQALLTYLVLHRHAPQARRHLAFLFWPDSTETQARTNLRHLLHELLHALPDAERFLWTDAQTVQWQPDGPYKLDIAEFDAANASDREADLRRAVGLYRGDLLPDCYEDWVAPERGRLRRAYAAALERLIALAEDRRDILTAITDARRLLEHDPCYEPVYRSLMRLHALNGDRAAALHIYHTAVTVLRRELGVPPDAATRLLHERLLNADAAVTAPPVRSVAATHPLVGRKTEWARLQTAWRSATEGRPQMALLVGEAGIGKTRLAEELEAWAARQGIVTASARGYAAEGALPYAPVAAWLRARPLPPLEPVWLTDLARLLPELLIAHPMLRAPEPLHQAWQRNRLFEALARGVLCCRRPRLLVLNDLHWCDGDTVEWLRYLLRFEPCAPLLIVATLCIGENWAPELTTLLAALRRDGLLTEIELGPLDAAATAALVGHVTGRPLAPGLADLLFQGSEGNPLFVIEMAQASLAQGDAGGRERETVAHAHAMIAAPQPLPAKVRQVIEHRLGQLSPAGRALAELAATIGRQFDLDVLGAAAELADETLVRGLDELWQRRIIREQGGGYDFSHDKIRETAYNEVTLARRRLLHRRVAQALTNLHPEDLGAVSGQIGRHYELAGMPAPAVAHYRRAAEASAQVYANADAILCYRRALILLDNLPGERQTCATVWERLGDILQLTGQHEAARAAYRQALESINALDRTAQARLLRKLGNAWREERRFDQAQQALDEADRLLGEQPTFGANPFDAADAAAWCEWVELQIDRNQLQYWQNRLHEAAGRIGTLAALVEQHAAADQQIRYFISAAMICLRRDRYAPGASSRAYLQAAQVLAQGPALAQSVPAIQFQLGFLHLWHGAQADAAERLGAALALAERSGDITLQARCLTYLACIARLRGDVEEVQPRTAQLLGVAAQAQMPDYIAVAHACQAWLAERAGDLEAVFRHGEAALALWAGLPFDYPFHWLALWPLLAAALQRSPLDHAVRYARGLLHPAQQLLPEAVAAELQAADASAVAGHSTQARSHLHAAVELAQASGQL
jgi:DNA-binding SARP family transcriptional activator